MNSSKGKAGGFYLTRTNLQNNLRDIIEVFDGDRLFESCAMGLPECSSTHPCPMHEVTFEFRRSLNSIVNELTIKEMANKVQSDGLSF